MTNLNNNTTSNPFRQSVFNLAPNHEELLLPLEAQNSPLVDVAVRVWGPGGTITVQKSVKWEDGNSYNLVIGEFFGTTLVETIEGSNRYAPLYGYLNSGEHLPEELYPYVGQVFPLPPGSNISFLLSDADIEMVQEASQGNSIGVRSGFHNNSQNSWVIKAQIPLYQAVTMLCPRTKDLKTDEVNGFNRTPSVLINEPLHLELGVNIMGYSNFNGGYPYSQLTTQEINHPLIAHFMKLITQNREYGFQRSGKNGSRAYAPTSRNTFIEGKTPKPSLERTSTPTLPTQFMDESEDDARLVSVASSSTSTPLTGRYV